jgi:PEP-CTERM motif
LSNGTGYQATLDAAHVPEPSTALLVIAGVLGLAGWRRVRA